MNKRKGVEVTNVTTMAILAIFVASVTIAGASNMVSMYQVGMEEEITSMVSTRISSGVYALDSYPEGSLEMDLKAEYRIEPVENNKAVNVSSGSFTDSPDPVFEMLDREPGSRASVVKYFYTDSEVKFDSFTASKVCAVKESGKIEIRGGEC